MIFKPIVGGNVPGSFAVGWVLIILIKPANDYGLLAIYLFTTQTLYGVSPCSADGLKA
jgi:hypothetical protein